LFPVRKSSLLAGALALLLSACSPGGPAVSDADRRVAAEEHPKILAEFGGSYDGRAAGYLADVGEKVAKAAGLGGKCHFTLVNTDVVNAFAVPGCYIYLTRGLMGLVNSEDELASVLAHELGHIVANHGNAQRRQSVLSQLGVMAIEAITGSNKLARLAGAAAGLNALRYSREHEYEADDLGLSYLRKAGYDPYAAPEMLQSLQSYQDFLTSAAGGEADANTIPEWALTHPLTRNRIVRSEEAAERSGVKQGEHPELEAAYLGHVDGLLFGDDPQQGFVLGRSFSHPQMRIAFEAPTGFTLTNSPQAVLIEGPNGTRGEFGGAHGRRMGPDAYAEALLKSLVRDTPARVLSARRGAVNGAQAFMVQATIETGKGVVPISLATYARGNGELYHFLMVSQPGTEAQQGIASLFGSFRFLDAAQTARLKPRYIRVAQVRPGDTLQSLAARMAADRPVEMLLMLNGRSAAQGIRPGERLKLVEFAPG